MIKKVLECVPSFKEDSREKTMDICRRRDGPWMAAEGGIHLSVYFSYQVPPNIYTKCVLYSECLGDVMSIPSKSSCPTHER